ncbi:leader peptidase (prepilin peptidase) / N-methyltransferase [Terribacillus aidingensis]|uniref:Prepilin leader peptidase/N-methyltransferase n=1 Tax=Terribacillus aidingensis TaxID=586416 RepID=A0A285NR01_9BACI|nr:A24 family peptidase [Terribacillus aidingensis]SNZ11383.1 leader peptidase (prepilin peptidase) / N-methyltransferase [Terribacillus aidingensis]
MSIFLFFYFIILGGVLGSFYNVVGMRVPQKKMFQSERSYCPNCKQQLKAYDLIPVISYITLGGKCRSCKQNISPLYPFTELATGLLFSCSYYVIGLEWELVTAFVLVSMAAILFVTDMKFMLIPNKILLFFLPLFIILRVITPLDPWWNSIIGAVVAFVLLFLVILFSRGGMGGGDLKLFVVLGVVLGWKGVLLTFFLASVIGAIISFMLLLTKVLKRKQAIPFGPYILLGALITYFHGEAMISWYFKSFF